MGNVTEKGFIGLTAFGYVKKIGTIPGSTTEVAEVSLLAGKDKDDKTRYLNGSFILSDRTEGLRAVERKLTEAKSLKSDANVLVVVEIKDFHGEPSISTKNNQQYVNYRGFMESIRVHVAKNSK